MGRYDAEDEEGQEPELQSAQSVAALHKSLALGFVSMAPLILVYEWAVARASDGPRNTSELLLFRGYQLLGEGADRARQWTLLGLFLLALVLCLKRDLALIPRIGRIVAEGAGCALLAGPILIGAIHLLRLEPPPALGAVPGRASPELVIAGRVLGAGAYEELLFRVGLYSAIFFSLGRVGLFLGLTRGLAVSLAEVLAALGSAAAFAAFHLAPFVGWLGRGGEAFDGAIFAYRFLAGLLLALLFRWRGPGVAAWTHACFNLALLLGAGPDVFLCLE